MLAISLLPMPLALTINELIFVMYLQGSVRVVHDVPIQGAPALAPLPAPKACSRNGRAYHGIPNDIAPTFSHHFADLRAKITGRMCVPLVFFLPKGRPLNFRKRQASSNGSKQAAGYLC